MLWVAMDYLYSLYDALVSINVPSDKARAVVDAMERDMGTTLATKQDLLLLATKEDHLLLKQDVALLRQEVANRYALLDRKIESARDQLDQKIDGVRDQLGQKIGSLRGDISRDLAALELKLTIKLGSMIFLGFGLMIAAMRLWT